MNMNTKSATLSTNSQNTRLTKLQLRDIKYTKRYIHKF